MDVRFAQQETPIKMALIKYPLVRCVCIVYFIKCSNGTYITRFRVAQTGQSTILVDSPHQPIPFKECERDFHNYVDQLVQTGLDNNIPSSKKIINFPDECDIEMFVRTLVGSGEFTIREIRDGYRKAPERRAMGADSDSRPGI